MQNLGQDNGCKPYAPTRPGAAFRTSAQRRIHGASASPRTKRRLSDRMGIRYFFSSKRFQVSYHIFFRLSSHAVGFAWDCRTGLCTLFAEHLFRSRSDEGLAAVPGKYSLKTSCLDNHVLDIFLSHKLNHKNVFEEVSKYTISNISKER